MKSLDDLQMEEMGWYGCLYSRDSWLFVAGLRASPYFKLLILPSFDLAKSFHSRLVKVLGMILADLTCDLFPDGLGEISSMRGCPCAALSRCLVAAQFEGGNEEESCSKHSLIPLQLLVRVKTVDQGFLV